MIPTMTVHVASTLAPIGWAMVALVGAGLAAILVEATARRPSEPELPVSRPSDELSNEMDELQSAA